MIISPVRVPFDVALLKQDKTQTHQTLGARKWIAKQIGGQSRAACLHIIQGFMAVNIGFACAQQIQVWAVQDKQCFGHGAHFANLAAVSAFAQPLSRAGLKAGGNGGLGLLPNIGQALQFGLKLRQRAGFSQLFQLHQLGMQGQGPHGPGRACHFMQPANQIGHIQRVMGGL